ncbi:hypothetical protein CBL_00010 [Carabus blaptoides fortunei]
MSFASSAVVTLFCLVPSDSLPISFLRRGSQKRTGINGHIKGSSHSILCPLCQDVLLPDTGRINGHGPFYRQHSTFVPHHSTMFESVGILELDATENNSLPNTSSNGLTTVLSAV